MTQKILKMQNPVQAYAWGSKTAISQLMGHEASSQPEAELWMGAHPKASSQVWCKDQWRSLEQLIRQYPDDMLGKAVAKKFDQTLPYLFKVLAAAQPLSIQAHPDQIQAYEGYHRENRQGLAIDAPQRNYKDDQPKPECMCALTPFWGLCGFRSMGEMKAVIEPVWPPSFNQALAPLTLSPNDLGLKSFFELLMRLGKKQRTELVAHVVGQAERLGDRDEAYQWIPKLNRYYPDDIGVLSPLLLNVIKLDPGEAIFLPPKQLHAYLEGLGIELMANSDNVLRGGLTPKHIDVDELINNLDFHSFKPELLIPQLKNDVEKVYASFTETFSLAQIDLIDHQPFSVCARFQGPEIIINIHGDAEIVSDNDGTGNKIEQGHSVFIPASVDGYTLKGNARLYKASVNLQHPG